MKYIRIVAIALICMFAAETQGAVNDLALLKAARRGDVPSMRRIGIRMCQGICFRGDPATGIQWLEKAAEHGDVDAMCYLGRVYIKLKDERRAAKHLRDAAKRGNGKAEKYMEELSLEYSREIVEKKAMRGSYKACMRLVEAYLLGERGLDINGERAWEWFERARKLNQKDTMVALRSWKVSQTLPIWEKLAEEQKDIDAIMLLAKSYEDGIDSVFVDEEKAKKYYSEAASLGNLRAKEWLKERGLPHESQEEKEERLVREAEEENKAFERMMLQKEAAEKGEAEKAREFFRALLDRLGVQSAKFLRCRRDGAFDEELSRPIIDETSDFSGFCLVGRVIQKIGERQFLFLPQANGVPVSVNVPPDINVNFADGDKVEGVFARVGEYRYKSAPGRIRTMRNYVLVVGTN